MSINPWKRLAAVVWSSSVLLNWLNHRSASVRLGEYLPLAMLKLEHSTVLIFNSFNILIIYTHKTRSGNLKQLIYEARNSRKTCVSLNPTYRNRPLKSILLIQVKGDMLSRKSLKITRDEPRKRVNFTGAVNRFVFRPDCLLEEISWLEKLQHKSGFFLKKWKHIFNIIFRWLCRTLKFRARWWVSWFVIFPN